ncbi:hypothetical protein [Protaetiibacter intestinalis]|uniref:Uncharacterized protein n=1 Tax=Protaetiibacter intestinalis TaxID=2419774 RepID=A0A387B262_9MICO|nr:hypothetical protein [Protaetiibacter intestinalis]AYF97604.1 hypothetical protein D7I47_04555 [Protaetiibacter intestinalis]
MAELDELLRDSITRIADTTTPERDSAGVADAIRSRVAAGDTGAPATSSTAPGWSGGGGAGWIPWIGVVVVAGLVGGAVGVSGVVAHPVHEVSVVGANSLLAESVDAASCPGGPVVRSLPADSRVLTVERSEDGASLGVRDPDALSQVIWLPASAVVADDPAGIAGLPVGAACPTVTVQAETPEPAPSPAPSEEPAPGPKPAPQPNPQPAPDTTAPVISAISASPTLIVNDDPTTITVAASDAVGVTHVELSWTGGVSGSASMTKPGANWTYTFSSNSPTPNDLTFTARAYDAAGNASAPASVAVDWQYFG